MCPELTDRVPVKEGEQPCPNIQLPEGIPGHVVGLIDEQDVSTSAAHLARLICREELYYAIAESIGLLGLVVAVIIEAVTEYVLEVPDTASFKMREGLTDY